MNQEFKEQVWKGQFKGTEQSAVFEDKLRAAFGLQYRYEAARLLLGRSLAEMTPPDPASGGAKGVRPIPGEHLFGDDYDLWMSALILDGGLPSDCSIDEFRALVEAHWARGCILLQQDLERCGNDEVKLLQTLADLIPESHAGSGISGAISQGSEAEIRLRVGNVSTSLETGQEVSFGINGPGVAPHIALMGAIGKGKTTTGIQIAMELVEKARIPFLFIDPKGEFVRNGKVVGPLEKLGRTVGGIEVGTNPVPLDFLPAATAPSQKIARASMRLRDTVAMCCKSVGDLQKDLLRTAVQGVIQSGGERSLGAVRDHYEQLLLNSGKKSPDSIVSRLNEMTDQRMLCFTPTQQPSDFFSRSWVISLHQLPEELKRLVTLVMLDSVSAFLLEQTDSGVIDGYRQLRHLLVVDEARKTLRERRSESLVDLVRQGRSKGSVVMLLSQDPSDFQGEQDDFLGQIGTVVAFACNQSKAGLGALEGVFGRKLQSAEFTDTNLPQGVAFTKVPGSLPEKIKCWEAK